MIKNSTRKLPLAKKKVIKKTMLQKATGLMFRKKIINTAIIFPFTSENIVPLHMLFVFFPIDVLFLNKDGMVVELKQNLRPFTFYTPKKKSMTIIELPAGTISRTKTKVMDRIDIR